MSHRKLDKSVKEQMNYYSLVDIVHTTYTSTDETVETHPIEPC